MPRIIETKLIEKFNDGEPFTRRELYDFYRDFEPELKESTFGWRIYDLKQRQVISERRRGVYALTSLRAYTPELSSGLIALARRITKRFEEVKFCIWDTSWLNEFTRHQSRGSAIIIEIEKGFEESLFYELKDTVRREIYLNPDEKTIALYIAESDRPVIVKKLVTRSPLSERRAHRLTLNVPALEKILVDVFSEEKLFHYLQGSELMHVFDNALGSYTINLSRLFSYASRREREQQIRQFLVDHMLHQVKGMIDD